jgi:hypothetical protein
MAHYLHFMLRGRVESTRRTAFVATGAREYARKLLGMQIQTGNRRGAAAHLKRADLGIALWLRI